MSSLPEKRREGGEGEGGGRVRGRMWRGRSGGRKTNEIKEAHVKARGRMTGEKSRGREECGE